MCVFARDSGLYSARVSLSCYGHFGVAGRCVSRESGRYLYILMDFFLYHEVQQAWKTKWFRFSDIEERTTLSHVYSFDFTEYALNADCIRGIKFTGFSL